MSDLEIQNLVKRFGGVTAVDGVSLSVDPGKTLSLVGESGCGKSTTVKLMLGVERPTRGRVLFEGKDLQELTAEQRRHYRASVQAVFQDPWGSLNPRMRIAKIIGEPLAVNRRMRKAGIKDRVASLLLDVGLEPQHGERYPHEFSGGQRQRIAIARAIALNPDDPGSYSNLGNALRALGRHDAAEASHRQALTVDPNYLEARYNLGLVLKDQGKFDEGIACLEEAVRRKADYIDAHWDLALAWLMKGDLRQGFDEYEWRWQLLENKPQRFNKPAWSGAALDGRVILLHAEQGMGDSIQFARYALLVAAKGGRVILECQTPLVTLFEQLEGVEQVVARDDPLPAFDVHAPLLSLPRIFKTDLDSIPAPDA